MESSSSHRVHGVLHATVFQAVELINEHRKSPNFLRKLFTCWGRQLIEEIEELMHVGQGLSKLYATIDIGTARVARTRVINHNPTNPQWAESFRVSCAYEADQVIISVKDNLIIGAVVVGKAHIPATEILSAEVVEGWYDLCSVDDCSKKRGKICVRLRFENVKEDPCWGVGIKDPDLSGVPFTFFKQKKGNRIRLYQDAHMPDNFMPEIPLEGGTFYEPTRCWEDMYKAIDGAKHFIYITGWSVFTKISLIRDRHRMIPGAQGVTLGDLLKHKAEEGVTVLLLVWDDKTSFQVLNAKTPGIMHTHDEDTQAYFRGSKVHCVLCPRNPDDGSSLVQGIAIGLMFTHHQKTLIVDAAASRDGKQRKLVSFIGGIDLCNGRYDTQYHSLFRTLDTVHKDDFQQTNFEGAALKFGGPRQPWHDVHSMLEGPAAWDVHFNFEQRWKRQGKKDIELLPLKEISSLWPPAKAISEDDPEAWNAQIFRSIDEGAVVGFLDDPAITSAMGLESGKEKTIDRSIQDGYIHAIRRAKDFIYMENQYFLGSSASWSSNRDSGALQLIPMELTLKIVSKIESGERFAVYIVLPMWPEGVPEHGSVQAILYWQTLTMEMMYKRIAKALQTKGMCDAKPTDYLNFFCLGNRETRLQGEYKAPEAPRQGTDYRRAQEHRRFMIYVHAKTMIVDDEYIIVGSANCNQRSMDGGRDSEIAVGAFQPHRLASSGRARGQVHGFRMSLWYEHTGRQDDDFLHPESLECVKKMRRVSEEHWDLYSGEEIVDLPGHLLMYPIRVLQDGSVASLEGHEHFPDTKAPVLGTHQSDLPSLLTV